MVHITREVSPAGKALELALRHLENKVAKVGWFENSKYEDGTPVAAVAAQNEFGNPSKHIPARPFMRPTIATKKKDWQKIAEKGAKAILADKATTENVMELLGKQVVFDIQKTISQLTQPPLSPVTIAARLARKADKKHVGSLTKPLIDTSVMFTTIISKVEDAS